MTPSAPELDLVVLTADKDTQIGVQELLKRDQALAIRPIRSKVLPHPGRDPAVLRDCHNFLRSFLSRADYCLVIFDRHGCGDPKDRCALEALVEARLTQNGWRDRSAAIVIDPELEVWVWSDSPHVDAILGWPSRGRQLKEWLRENRRLEAGRVKPDHPEEAMLAALRESRRPASSAIFGELAKRVSFHGCTDPAFLKLKEVLRRWFPRSAAT